MLKKSICLIFRQCLNKSVQFNFFENICEINGFENPLIEHYDTQIFFYFVIVVCFAGLSVHTSGNDCLLIFIY